MGFVFVWRLQQAVHRRAVFLCACSLLMILGKGGEENMGYKKARMWNCYTRQVPYPVTLSLAISPAPKEIVFKERKGIVKPFRWTTIIGKQPCSIILVLLKKFGWWLWHWSKGNLNKRLVEKIVQERSYLALKTKNQGTRERNKSKPTLNFQFGLGR